MLKLYRAIALFFITGLLILLPGAPLSAFGEVPVETEVSCADGLALDADFLGWLPGWLSQDALDAGKVTLTPGNSDRDLNFSWYASRCGTPAVAISKEFTFSDQRIFRGGSLSIDRTNGTMHYSSADHVSICGYFEENTTYYYRYTDDISTAPICWSRAAVYRTGSFTGCSAILAGDVQSGASGNIAADAYNWKKTLSRATETAPDASFILSAGDQADCKTDSEDGLRELQYAGFLYPSELRSLPVAAAIGNHDTKATDYRYHFNNPNSEGSCGNTPAGCDYYFTKGNVLFIVLNSNNRKISSHRKLMKQAVDSNPDAMWRIAVFHHDIYGSGVYHSDRSAANIRMIMAPLMDEFLIDAAISGHDHSYARSYPILDGTVINAENGAAVNTGGGTTVNTENKTSVNAGGGTLTDPAGTVYLSLGTASGSKMYGLASPRQFYVAERSNDIVPTFSTLKTSGDALTVSTYDYNGKKYAGDLIIRKTRRKTDPLSTYRTAASKKKTAYTKKSFQKLTQSLKNFRAVFHPTSVDTGAQKAEQYFHTANDPLSYYGYRNGTTDALPDGFSTLLDKTRLQQTTISAETFSRACEELSTAVRGLKKTTLTVKKKKKKLKNGAAITMKTGVTLQLKLKRTPKKGKVKFSSAAKKYVKINKRGQIRARRKRKSPVRITIHFENRVFQLRIRVR